MNERLLLGPSHSSVHDGTQMPKWLEAHHLCMASCEFVSFAEHVCPIAWHHVIIFLNVRWAESQTCTVIMRPYGPSCTLLCSKVFFELSDWVYCFFNAHGRSKRTSSQASFVRTGEYWPIGTRSRSHQLWGCPKVHILKFSSSLRTLDRLYWPSTSFLVSIRAPDS